MTSSKWAKFQVDVCVCQDSVVNKKEGLYTWLLKYYFHDVRAGKYIIFLLAHGPKWDFTVYKGDDFEILISFRND